MRGGGGNLESCRASAGPKVRACVQSAMVASRPKAALFDAAKVSAPKPGDAADRIVQRQPAKAPASLVAPPRTISDIAAILDQQKPDPAKIAELTTTAEAPVPGGPEGARRSPISTTSALRQEPCSAAPTSARRCRTGGQQWTRQRLRQVGSRYEQLLMRQASRSRPAQACKCASVEAAGGICQSVKGKAVRPAIHACCSATSETATPTRRKAMSPAIVRCLLKHNGGRFFRSTA